MAKDFIPAASFHVLTPVYDGFIHFFFGKTFKKIASVIHPKDNEKIIDIGCGPGNLLIELHHLHKNANLTGLDIDPAILKIAKRKLEKFGVPAELKEASAADIPYQNGLFDLAVSSLMIHRLSSVDKQKFIKETFRILKPGGKIYLYDFAPPRTAFGKFLSYFYGWFEEIEDGVNGKYWDFMKEAGFKNLRSVFRTELFELVSGEK